MLSQPRPSRRQTLKLSGAMAVLGAMSLAGVATAASSRARVAPKPMIKPRSAWAQGLAPVGPIPREDVKFLIIHHSQSPNGYSPAKVPATLRGFYKFHTGKKGWPDVAYNFFVDDYGVIWEGRAGSLAGPVQGSATGGNQGYTQLCCFVGDFTARPPSPAAMAAMAKLLAWLAGRYQIDLTGQTPIVFISRGSNKWKRGRKVTTRPIVGHRDMSMTACPGDALYALITGTLTKAAISAAGQTTPQPRQTATSPTKPQPDTTTPTAPQTTNSQPASTTESPTAAPTSFGRPATTRSIPPTTKTTANPTPTVSPSTSAALSPSGEATATSEPVAYTTSGWDSGAYAGAGIVGATVVGALTWAAFQHKKPGS